MPAAARHSEDAPGALDDRELCPEAWIVDDTGSPNVGRHSVVVASPYCLGLRKVANCPVGRVGLGRQRRALLSPPGAYFSLKTGPRTRGVDARRTCRRRPRQSLRSGARGCPRTSVTAMDALRASTLVCRLTYWPFDPRPQAKLNRCSSAHARDRSQQRRRPGEHVFGIIVLPTLHRSDLDSGACRRTRWVATAIDGPTRSSATTSAMRTRTAGSPETTPPGAVWAWRVQPDVPRQCTRRGACNRVSLVPACRKTSSTRRPRARARTFDGSFGGIAVPAHVFSCAASLELRA